MTKLQRMMETIRQADPVAAAGIRSRFNALFDEVEARAAACQREKIFQTAKKTAERGGVDGRTTS
jgi:hypothetical protein